MASMEQQAGGRPERLQTVDRRSTEPDRRGVLEVAGPRRDLPDPEAELRCLHEQLGIEAEVERISQERDREQELAAVGAIAGVKVGETCPQDPVLDRGQEAV